MKKIINKAISKVINKYLFKLIHNIFKNILMRYLVLFSVVRLNNQKVYFAPGLGTKHFEPFIRHWINITIR